MSIHQKKSLFFSLASGLVRVFRTSTNFSFFSTERTALAKGEDGTRSPNRPYSAIRASGRVRSAALRQSSARSAAFTLIELMVSITIFTVITSVAVFNHAQFNASVLLTNLAYEVGLSIRQAQFYGIVVRQTTADPTKFDSGYGIRFDLSSPSTYTLFEDVKSGSAPNHIHDGSDVDIQTFKIARGNKISRICVDANCSNTIVDITFVRPNPDAYIRASGVQGTSYGKAEICVSSPQNLKRKVTVESTGQISVDTDTSGVCN